VCVFIDSQCAKGATIYTALNMEQSWNLTDLTNTKELSNAIADLKATDITIPHVNFTNAILSGILNELQYALGSNQLNITKLVVDVSGSIIAPDLRLIRDDAQTVTTEDLSNEVRIQQARCKTLERCRCV